MAIGAVALAPFLVVSAVPALVDPLLLAACLAVGVASSVVPYGLEQVAMRRLPRARFALLLALLPATATVIGALVLGQVPGAVESAGIALDRHRRLAAQPRGFVTRHPARRVTSHNFRLVRRLQFTGIRHMEAGALRAPAALNRISVTAPLLRLRSDEQLVALFRAGNDAAFSVIHDRYRQRLFVYARQMLGGSRQDAEDALQDVFLRAYSSLRVSDRPVSLRAWLYRVAHNRCIDHLRKPVPPAIDLFETSRRPLHDPTIEAERRDDLRRLIEDVRRLPEQQRSALLMREMDGLSYAELSEVLGVSLQAVKSLLVRARIGLVEAVEARDTACVEIRSDLADAFDRGVRASGRARKHMRDCTGCSAYRTQLRGVREGLGGAVARPRAAGRARSSSLGIGGAAGGGAASSGAAAGGGAIVVAGGGTAAKVTAVVCCAALAAGGAAEVTHKIIEPTGRSGGGAASQGAGRAGGRRSPRSARAAPHAGGRRRRALGAPRAAKRGGGGAGGARAPREPRSRATRRLRRARPRSCREPRPAIDPADAVTGGSTAPDEESGFGHGVDGLTPRCGDARRAARRRRSTRVAASGGATAPSDTAAGGGQSVHGSGLVGRDRAGIVQVAS